MSRIAIVESPFRASAPELARRNKAYLCAAIRDARLTRGDLVWASHALYTHYLDDNDETERSNGLDAHLEMINVLVSSTAPESIVLAVYNDLGVSPGMLLAIDAAVGLGIPTVQRSLGSGWRALVPEWFRPHPPPPEADMAVRVGDR